MQGELTPQQGLSKRLFGRTHCLTVWSAVIEAASEPPHTFRQNELMMTLQQTSGVQPSSTQSELAVLKELGVLERTANFQGAPYRLTDSPFRAVIEAAVMSCVQLFPQENNSL